MVGCFGRSTNHARYIGEGLVSRYTHHAVEYAMHIVRSYVDEGSTQLFLQPATTIPSRHLSHGCPGCGFDASQLIDTCVVDFDNPKQTSTALCFSMSVVLYRLGTRNLQGDVCLWPAGIKLVRCCGRWDVAHLSWKLTQFHSSFRVVCNPRRPSCLWTLSPPVVDFRYLRGNADLQCLPTTADNT